MSDEVPRSRTARFAAEQALVRIVHHYGATPEFVVLGGLVPELLCSKSDRQTALTELSANFANLQSQGPIAYAEQFVLNHADYDPSQARADAVAAVGEFCDTLAEARAKLK